MNMVITEDVHDTMRIACLGPQFSDRYSAAEELLNSDDEIVAETAYATIQELDALQEAGEAEYFATWRENVLAEAERHGYDRGDVRVLDTSEHWKGTRTLCGDAEDDGDTIERALWQAAHDSTPSPTAWAAEWIPA